MEPAVRNYLALICKKGGKKSKRKLSPFEARNMVKIRETRRAFKDFYTLCFWSFDPEYKIMASDISWVAEQLKKNGGQKAWEKARYLCR